MPWRTFIAVELPPALVDALRPAIQALGEIGGVRVSAPAGIHLTLHFLGNVEPKILDELVARIAALLVEQRRFEVDVRGVDAFPSVRRPQVFFADLVRSQSDPLIGLRASIRPAISEVGLPIEARPFTPHLTLGRARRRLQTDEARAVAAWHREWGDVFFATLPVRQVSLMRSELGGGSPRYTELRKFLLQ